MNALDDPVAPNPSPGRRGRTTPVTMSLGDVRDLLDAQEVFCPDPGARFAGVVAADLMSDVLVDSQPGALLLTGLANVQTVRTAAIADLAGIVFVRGKAVPDDVLALARDKGIPLLLTGRSLFEAAGTLFAARAGAPADEASAHG